MSPNNRTPQPRLIPGYSFNNHHCAEIWTPRRFIFRNSGISFRQRERVELIGASDLPTNERHTLVALVEAADHHIQLPIMVDMNRIGDRR